MVDDFADGVFFVSLAPLRDATLVHASIAATLGVREQGGQTLDEALADYLSRKDMLLLLDNFEQVVEAAPQLAPLLASSNVSLLVTSREPLRLAAERVHSVPPLSTPERNGPIAAADALSHSAVRLFVERPHAVRAEFELTDEVASDVAAICSQLDGMPLAVELAAARTNVLSPSALLQRLGKTLDTLSSGGRDVDERRRTLRAAIAWSYDLLPPEEQTLFEQLCVFVGGCRLEAAEEVCVGGVDVLTGLSSLAEKSLLRIRDDDDGERRFWMFETIREYALERLDARGEAAESRRRRLRYCADLATRAGAELAGPGAGAWLEVLEREINNIRIALADAADLNDRELGLSLVIEPARFWIAHGRLGEARRALADLLGDRDGLPDALAGRACSIAADFALWQNDYGQAAKLAEAAVLLLDAAGLADRIPRALITLGWAMDADGKHERAASVVEQALPLAREAGDLRTAAGALNTLAHFREVQGDYIHALEFYDECLEQLVALDDRLNLGIVLGNVGGAALGPVTRSARSRLSSRASSLHASSATTAR